MNNCKYYDEEMGWCKMMIDWRDPMPVVRDCIGKDVCKDYYEENNNEKCSCYHEKEYTHYYTDYEKDIERE